MLGQIILRKSLKRCSKDFGKGGREEWERQYGGLVGVNIATTGAKLLFVLATTWECRWAWIWGGMGKLRTHSTQQLVFNFLSVQDKLCIFTRLIYVLLGLFLDLCCNSPYIALYGIILLNFFLMCLFPLLFYFYLSKSTLTDRCH